MHAQRAFRSLGATSYTLLQSQTFLIQSGQCMISHACTPTSCLQGHVRALLRYSGTPTASITHVALSCVPAAGCGSTSEAYGLDQCWIL